MFAAEAKNVVVEFPAKSSGLSLPWKKPAMTRVLKSVSIAIPHGKTLGLVGESGSGKSTLARAIMRLQKIAAGEIFYDGENVTKFSARMPLRLRGKVQMIFQNPYASLDPRQTVFDILSEPLEIHFPEMTPRQRRERVAELLEIVGLPSSHAQRFPHEFSGGQRQRIAISRALATAAKLIICDEPVSALDVSVQAQILELLKKIQKKENLALLFIGHDLAVVKSLADTVAVMRCGEIVERGSPREVFENPQTEYTRALLAAIPRLPSA